MHFKLHHTRNAAAFPAQLGAPLFPLSKSGFIKTAILCGSMFLPFSSFSQQRCKYVKQIQDEWTKKTINNASMTIGASIAMREVILQEKDGTLFLGLRLTFSDMGDVEFKKGDKFSFLLENGEIIECTSPMDVKPINIQSFGATVKHWFVHSEVDKKTFEKLAASRIKAIRFHLNGADMNMPEIKERQTQKIMETAACMLSNLKS